jgi:predicted acylesterase/phospholipase RssA
MFTGLCVASELAECRTAGILLNVESKPITILSIDGGGMRALIPALLLAEIERRTGHAVCRLFDLVAGTSAGGVVALALASPNASGAPHSADAVVDFIRQEGKRIFHRPWWYRMMTLGGFFGPIYPASGLLNALQRFFGNTALSNILCEALIPTFDLTLHQPYFFTRERARKHLDENLPAYRALYAGFAVPAFFPPLVVLRNTPQGRHLLADGGLYINNPALAAFFEARRLFPEADDFIIVSLGTGRLAWPLTCKRLSLPQWLTPAESIQSDGQNDVTISYLKDVCAFLGSDHHRYVRLEPWVLPEHYSLTDASDAHLSALTEIAEQFIREHDEMLDNLCAELVARAT